MYSKVFSCSILLKESFLLAKIEMDCQKINLTVLEKCQPDVFQVSLKQVEIIFRSMFAI